jgi:hypothetical protein
MKITSTIALIVLVAFSLGFRGCKQSEQDKALEAAAKNPGVAISRAVSQRTPKEINVFGKTALSQATLAQMDEGIDQFNAAATTDGFTKLLPHQFYTILTPPYPCILSPVQRIPSFVTSGGTYYDGSIYDYYNPKGKLKTRFTDTNGLDQWYVKDGYSAVFAPEYIVDLTTMYVCPDASIVVPAVKHGGDHLFLGNVPYSEETRGPPPFDGYAYFWCSIYHGGDRNHPLLPRNGRCLSEAVKTELHENFGKDLPIPTEIKNLAGELGLAVTDSDTWRIGIIVRPVR